MSSFSDLQIQKDNAKEAIKLRDEVLKLDNNPEFRHIILELFCTEECARAAQASSDFTLPETNRKNALLQAQAPGALKRFLIYIINAGNNAENSLPELEESIRLEMSGEGE